MRLLELHAALVQQHNLDWHFVRREWAPVLDARPEEAERCERLVAESMMENLLVQ
jgi:hypothetical protein